jgi:uncharacterized membrane protein YkvA (DUF1232 family)
MVVIAVAVPPGPIFLLFARRQTAEVSVLVAVVVASPLMIVTDLHIVPDVVVAVIGVIDPVMVCASSAHDRKSQRASQE